MNDLTKEQKEINFSDLAPVMEFTCWLIVAVAPLLRLANGPAVTKDQWWIQIILFSFAFTAGCFLRLYLVSRHRNDKKATEISTLRD